MALIAHISLYGVRFQTDPEPDDYHAAIDRITRDMDRLEGFEGPRSRAAHKRMEDLRTAIERTVRGIELQREIRAAIVERGRV